MSGAPAVLALEDGTVLRGRSLGARGEAFGEIVFNTAMSGYQEVLTDPSYARQVVVMTAPQQGNYGTNAEDPESAAVQVAGFVVREASRRAWSWRARRGLDEELAAAGVVGIEDIDTRRLALRIRDRGAMRCGISNDGAEPESLVERARAHGGMAGADLAATVSAQRPYAASDLVGAATPVDGRAFRVAAYDFGVKRTSLRLLAAEGCDVVVYPARTPAREILAERFDGVFLSNGPGDPSATRYGIAAARELLGAVPIFGICLGHQLLAEALGGTTYKMKFGHRGANQPVVNVENGRVEITSHNHGFAVEARSWTRRSDGDPVSDGDPRSRARPRAGERPVVVRSDAFGGVALTHWNLNDGTLEGLRCLDVPAIGVQYHPEAAPGPHDSRYLLACFRRLMLGAAAA